MCKLKIMRSKTVSGISFNIQQIHKCIERKRKRYKQHNELSISFSIQYFVSNERIVALNNEGKIFQVQTKNSTRDILPIKLHKLMLTRKIPSPKNAYKEENIVLPQKIQPYNDFSYFFCSLLVRSLVRMFVDKSMGQIRSIFNKF